MQDAGCRSWGNYASRIREEHCSSGYAWTLQLDVAMHQAIRSVISGLGSPRQSASFALQGVHALDEDDVLTADCMPVNCVINVVIIALFMLREIEVAFLTFGHV